MCYQEDNQEGDIRSLQRNFGSARYEVVLFQIELNPALCLGDIRPLAGPLASDHRGWCRQQDLDVGPQGQSPGIP